MKLTVVRLLVILTITSTLLSCASPTKNSKEANTPAVRKTAPIPTPSLRPTSTPSQGNANKTSKAQNVSHVDIAGVSISVGEYAYVPQDRLEAYLVKTEGDTDTYSYGGNTYIISYGPGEGGAYFVKSIIVIK